jgi:hypothetical protein
MFMPLNISPSTGTFGGVWLTLSLALASKFAARSLSMALVWGLEPTIQYRFH